MTRWTSIAGFAFTFDAASLGPHWTALHASDCEPYPHHSEVLQTGWIHFHNGQFQEAFEIGLQAGEWGSALAAKSASSYATYIEPSERRRIELFHQVAQLCAGHLKAHPERASTHYWHAIALHRYSQGFSVAKVLAQGLGSKIRESLEATVRLQPAHADGHIALGLFHAEIIDKVGPLIGSMTYGVRKETALSSLRQGLELAPTAPALLMDYASALLMIEGDAQQPVATQLYEQAAATSPRDATELLQVALAQNSLTPG